MTWGNGKAGAATRHNARVRGSGTWSEQTTRLSLHERRRYRREMGTGTWADKDRRLDRERRHHERDQRQSGRRTARRNYGRAAAVGGLILSAVLLMSPATRGAALTILILAGLALYVTAGRERA
jgi:Flp pilus assembly protein TadB